MAAVSVWRRVRWFGNNIWFLSGVLLGPLGAFVALALFEEAQYGWAALCGAATLGLLLLFASRGVRDWRAFTRTGFADEHEAFTGYADLSGVALGPEVRGAGAAVRGGARVPPTASRPDAPGRGHSHRRPPRGRGPGPGGVGRARLGRGGAPLRVLCGVRSGPGGWRGPVSGRRSGRRKSRSTSDGWSASSRGATSPRWRSTRRSPKSPSEARRRRRTESRPLLHLRSCAEPVPLLPLFCFRKPFPCAQLCRILDEQAHAQAPAQGTAPGAPPPPSFLTA